MRAHLLPKLVGIWLILGASARIRIRGPDPEVPRHVLNEPSEQELKRTG